MVGAKLRLAILGRTADDVVRAAAIEIGELLDESIRTSRSLTAELSPPIVHEGGLASGLEWLSRWMADRHGLSVEVTVEGRVPPLAEDVKILLFEAVRELLFNAVKHARVRRAGVVLRTIEGSRLQVAVVDDGQGFDPAQLKPACTMGGGFGLFSIRERLGLIGGELQIHSAPGSGARFVLTAPIGAAPEGEPVPDPVASTPPG